ncbi:mitochondrial trans 2 enoyl coenzyme A reductase [Echinococcus multilocularis]|uniref:Enoyl-[acyl-carrier-protein] reductase, mitochondrial n=1 Tax=Echinococcus multilocularis TaxID=6211 RepID=A0A068Y8Y4_ECHMU|nr:mitochondrial trans 2 enoyl coenzyme A reductase [Echinococcus multilocularis]
MQALRGILRIVKPSFLFRTVSSWQIALNEHGEPLDVLYDRVVDIGTPKNKEVLVNYRFCPINPSDINAIQGTYPLKPSLPAVPGNEGAGYVLECGSGVSKLKPGDLTIPAKPGLGTWRNVAIYDESDLFCLNPRLDVRQAAVLCVNPLTAYFILNEHAKLKPGDCLIQNGATSAVGIYVMQMCKQMGVRTINLFRPRDTPEKTESTRQALLDFGGTVVLTEEELKQRKDFSELGKIKVGLDCLGGRPALTIIKSLDQHGLLINYGGMTRQPIPTPISALIFKGIQIRGFWLSGRRNQSHLAEKIQARLDELSDWIIDGKLKLSPVELFPHLEWKAAVSKALFKDDTPRDLPRKNVLSFPEVS